MWWSGLVGLVAMVPAVYLFYLFYTTTPSFEAFTTTSSLLQLGGTVLALIAALFTFGCTVFCCRYATACAPTRSTACP